MIWEVAKERNAEANGAAPMYVCSLCTGVGDTTAPFDLEEAAEYNRTPLGQHLNSTNKLLFIGQSYAVLFD
jgi:hypothetical protein